MTYLRRQSRANLYYGGPHSEQQPPQSTHHDMRKVLECPSCNDVPLPPVYTCSTGHTMCGKCVRNQCCPICKLDMTKTARNQPVEMVIANSQFSCKYFPDGCPRYLKGDEYHEHIESCPWRGVLCYETEYHKCSGQEIRFKDYFTHLQEAHEVQGSDMQSSTVSMSEYSNCLATDGPWPMYYFHYSGEIFLRHMESRNGTVYWWVTMIGSKSDAVKYKVKVTVYMKHNQKSRIDWIVPVYSVRECFDDMSHLFRVAIPAKQLEAYCTMRPHPHGGETFKYVMDLKYEIMYAYD